MNEKDKALAKQYLQKWGADNHITMYEGLDALLETFATALTSVRQAVRAAAFREMIELAQAIRPDGSINFIGDWNRARKQFIALLEAAANSVAEDSEGEGVDRG